MKKNKNIVNDKIFLMLLTFFIFLGVAAPFVRAQTPSPATSYGGESIVEFLKLFFPTGSPPQGNNPDNLPDASGTESSPDNSSTTPGASQSRGGFVFYCQGNPAWQNNCSLGSAGCGPTSLAMIISTLMPDKPMTPPQVDQVFRNSGWRSCSDAGSYLTSAIGSPWLKNLGFNVGPNIGGGGVLDLNKAKQFIDAGAILIASSQNFPCANCRSAKRIDHIFVVDGVNPGTSSVSIRDPNNCSYTNGNDENPARINMSVSAFSWYYAFPIIKPKP